MGDLKGAHVFSSGALEMMLDRAMGKTLGQADVAGIIKQGRFNKGVAGLVVETSILGYPQDSDRRADLIVDGVPTELKTTGILRRKTPAPPHFEAKEPMSITAVQPETIIDEEFESSAMLEKCEHLLMVYYEFLHKVKESSEYADFPLKGYEFRNLNGDDYRAVQADWTLVRDFIRHSHIACPENPQSLWPLLSSELNRHKLSVLDTSPKWPNRPRFRFKRAFVTSFVMDYFGGGLEHVEHGLGILSDLDVRCGLIAERFRFMAAHEILAEVGIPMPRSPKQVCEVAVTAMFGGRSGKMSRIEDFRRLSVTGHCVVLNPRGRRTEDFKLNDPIDFDEICDPSCDWESSAFRAMFSDLQLLVPVFREPYDGAQLPEAVFLGFKRPVLPDRIVDGAARACWDEMRRLVFSGELRDEVEYRSDGTAIVNASGAVRSAPNWPKSHDFEVFLRGSGRDANDKPLCVAGVRMYRQNAWIRGSSIAELLDSTPWL